MERNLSITKSTERFCSCNSCNAKNYDNDNNEKDVNLYRVKIGCMSSLLCSDCLAELIGKATVVLATERIG